MDSQKIKAAVGVANTIIATKDFRFEKQETKDLMDALVDYLVMNAGKSPTFAVAVIQKIIDADFDYSALKGEAFDRFNAKFGKTLQSLSGAQLSMVRKISDKMFQNI